MHDVYKWISQKINEGKTWECIENITEEKEAYLKEVFVNCSRFEYAFWDMSYKMEI